MIEFRLLGPFEGPVAVPGGKPRALLVRLLLDAGRVLTAPALVEALWESPPRSAAKILQVHISELRKALGAEAIATRGSGYALRGATSDLAQFERLTQNARRTADPGDRRAVLQQALELWRGEPLAEFRREPFAAAAAARIVELRLEALGQRIDAELELGAHEAVVGELTVLVDEEPLRERLRGQLMLALYRSGRQADALRVYRDGRAQLVEQLGIEPGPQLQGLERAILHHDPALAIAPASETVRRGPVVCVGVAPLPLLAPLGRELLLVELAEAADDLANAERRLDRRRHAANASAASVRTAAFTTGDAASDLARLAREQAAELLVVADAPEALLAAAPCDVALVNVHRACVGPGPIVVPFGGAQEEWPSLELAAWLARAHDRSLRLVGTEASAGRRDASRALAGASLALQRFAGITAQTALVAPGAAGVLAQRGAAIVASLPAGELDATRRKLLAADVPVLLVHGGLRPGGLAPDHTMTRFSWSLSGA